MTDAPFRQGTAIALAVVVGASFLGWLLLGIFRSDPLPDAPGADGYSSEAIGHVALVRTLEALDIPVLLSRHDSGGRAGDDNVLLVLEPTLDGPEGSRTATLRAMLRSARRVLLVLPKWEESQAGRGWLGTLNLRHVSEAQRVLEEAEVDGRVTRVDVPEAGAVLGPDPPAPTLEHGPVQLIEGSELTPLATVGGLVLLGEMVGGDQERLVLSDPDVLSNAGLHRPGNAELVVGAIERLRRGKGTLVLDETLHGFERTPSMARELLTPPLVFSIGHVALGLLLLVWAAGARFGAPLAPEPPFEPGTRGLLRTTAELLRAGGHVRDALPRYLAAVVEHVRAGLHAPAAEGPALERWLDHAGAARGVEDPLEALRASVRAAVSGPPSSARALAAALRIDRWRQEILDGPQRRHRPT